ncbi:MAG: MATE family efflux transporter [Puniceicoccales bacterium]|jgi:MATE family multidrug resistance protein|nr:MATE family efflux transporter [Puniceicoccales bacterium]
MKELTKYGRGSLRELWVVAWPLVISSAANMFMLVGDRIVLAHYSASTFNASLGAMPWIWTAFVPLLTIVNIADVLVGRFNGSGEHGRIGPTVWQMLWFSAVLLVPLGIGGWFLAPHLLEQSFRELGTPYMRVLFPNVAISLASFGALAAFYTGRGKTRFVLAVSIGSNLLNVILDIILVFGIGPFPEMGIVGSAVGTVVATILSFFLFFVPFLSKKNNKAHRTRDLRLNGHLFGTCLRIGTPNGFAAFINFALWSWIAQVMAHFVPAENFTAFGVSQSVYFCMLFFIEGISFGVSIIVSNAYGANNWDAIVRNNHSWMKLAALAFVGSFLLMVLYPRPLLAIICSGAMTKSFYDTLRIMLLLSWIAIATESITLNLRQTLTAFGDTRFTMLVNIVSYSGIVVFPSYIFLRRTHSAASFLAAEAVSNIVMLFLYSIRFRRWLRLRPAPPAN